MKKIIFVIFTTVVSSFSTPKYTDYCEMLARDIEGKQYSFIAGNKLYYIGGKVDEYWRPVKHETIGLMHPIFRDGRARGFGITEGAGGYGHDKFGWEFWNYTKGAIGTVIINEKKFVNIKPESMIWRPDRVICTYNVDDTIITEEKFISKNDILCNRITSSKPIKILFEGHSFVNPDNFPTFDGDKPGQTFSQTQTAKGNIVDNLIHIIEGGTTLVKPDWKKVAVGKIMYDGLSIVISSDAELIDPFIQKDSIGRQSYSFTLNIAPNEAVTLTYGMGDNFEEIKSNTEKILKNPISVRNEKSKYINDLLNKQIPYFRCSDDLTVKTYYYLWSLYFMYFTDIGEGFESYPHTQTAINNFMGLHLWDSWAYTALGSWIVDKWKYGYGNVLSWKHMVPFKTKNNSLPDNFGKTWYSPGVGMNLVGSVEFGWDMYRKSGDKKFLDVLYNDLFRPLYWDNNGPQPSMGEQINALHFLACMAEELNQKEDIAHWKSMHPRLYKNWSNAWEGYEEKFFANKGAPWKDIWNLAALLNYEMPKEWADQMTDRWTMNTEEGFLGPVSFLIRPPTEPENGVFAVSSISTWLAIEGLFRHDRAEAGIIASLSHINGMTKDYGFPVAPECWEPKNFKPWGSLYYNWDSAIADLILRRIIGADYSLQDDTLRFNEHLPDAWEWMESSIPIVKNGKTHWVDFKVSHKKTNQGLVKKIDVKNSPLKKMIINAWDNDRKILKGNNRLTTSRDSAHLSLLLGEKKLSHPTYVSVRPYQREFLNPLLITIDNIEQGTELRFTKDGSEPTKNSPIAPLTLIIDKSCDLKFKSWNRFNEPRDTFILPFKKAIIIPSEKVTSLSNGLKYKLFDGTFSRIPEFTNLEIFKEGLSKELNPIKIAKKETDFALQFKGYIKIPETGLYTFYLTSDDGSRMKINNKIITELNVRSELDPWMSEGNIALEKGFHPIEIDYFQYKKRSRLDLKYKVNGGNEITVDSSMFFHKSN